MKTKITIVALLCIIIIAACDKIDGPYREVNNSGSALDENSIVISGDTLTFASSTPAPQKKVLIEDYTGHLCGTCPLAGLTLNDTLRPLFGEELVILSIHSGHFADVCPTGLDCPGSAPAGAFTIDYKTTVGNEWTDFFGINANPLGMINRKGFPSTHKRVYRDWRSGIESELAIAPNIGVEIKNIYNSGTRELKAAARATLLNSFGTNLKMQMIVVEDSIVDWQQWYSHNPQLVPDYLHRDILRATMNGNYGEEINSSGSEAGEKFLNGYSMFLAPSWNADHCFVVAFVYDPDTYEIFQVEQQHIAQ